jgi:hypothetical protein
MGWKAYNLVRWLPLVWLGRFRNLAFDLLDEIVANPAGGQP